MKNSLIPNGFNRESNSVFLIRECFRELYLMRVFVHAIVDIRLKMNLTRGSYSYPIAEFTNSTLGAERRDWSA